jgi:hypothetical protein
MLITLLLPFPNCFAYSLCFPQIQYLLDDVALHHSRLNKIPLQVYTLSVYVFGIILMRPTIVYMTFS